MPWHEASKPQGNGLAYGLSTSPDDVEVVETCRFKSIHCALITENPNRLYV